VVRTFIADHLAGVTELEALIRLCEDRGRWWDVPAFAAALGLAQSRARRILDRFVSLNLLDIRVSDDVRYRFQPGTGELAEAADALLESYNRNPVAVVQCVASPGRALSDFADAFRIRPK
jgi:hypothetical protein